MRAVRSGKESIVPAPAMRRALAQHLPRMLALSGILTAMVKIV
jgi:hypothetical protein